MIKWSDKIINEKSVYEKKIYKDLALKKIDDHEYILLTDNEEYIPKKASLFDRDVVNIC